MKVKTEEFMKKYLIGFILGVVSACTISVIAATYFPSNDVTYDNKESGLSSTNVQGAIDELYTECTKESSAGEQIIEDAGLEKDPYECRYFFTGANPNNYVTFNDEKAGWRIISVECDGSIKIIRNQVLSSGQAWDNTSSTNWDRPSTINTYLNTTYFNTLVNSKDKIIGHTWNIGSITRNNDLSGQINEENSKVSQEAKIGLITVSEYIRTNSNKQNCGSFELNDNNHDECLTTNWMYNIVPTYQWVWTITTDKSLPMAYTISADGGVFGTIYSEGVVNALSVSPVLYLSSDIKITSGNGSQSNPYTFE